MRRWLAYMLAMVCAVGAASELNARGLDPERWNNVDSEHWTDEYDRYFKKYSKRYFGPYFDWRWFKAQAIAESGLDVNAKSWVGAEGLMQIMPATFAEIRRMNPHFEQVYDVRWNIAAGIYYDRYLYRQWPEVAGDDRMYFTLASYNAGLGGMIRAVKRSGMSKDKHARNWMTAKGYLPDETQGYVKRIRGLKKISLMNVSDRRKRGAARFISKFDDG